ncbi:hypothetical protein HDU84_007968 [Entophlyctis sp. JEL0112]|nr:hypothetical protein HDU84_007968 [Entophlyctis sp. JEL0112]
MANLASVPTHDSCVISIRNAMEDGKKLLAIPCGPSGKAWTRVLLFLSSVCGDFDPSCYSLKTANETNTAVTDVHLSEFDILFPGRYYLIPNEGVQPLDVIHQPFPIIPKGKNSRLTSGSSSSIDSSSATKKRKPVGAILNDIDDSVLVDGVVEINNRTNLFEKEIIARDNHCVITKEYVSTQAAHILSQSWWRDFENRKDLLPQSIRDTVSELRGGVNSVRNGILLRTDLAAAFDRGYFSFKFYNDHFYFIAITTEYECFDGCQLDENLRIRWNNSSWWSPETRPSKSLVEFHFRNSVFQHMKRSEEGNDMEWSDNEGILNNSVLIARKRVEKFFDGSQVGISLAKLITNDTLVDILEGENL